MRICLRIITVCFLACSVLITDASADIAADTFEVKRMEEALSEDDIAITGHISDDGKYNANGAIERAINNAAEKVNIKIKAEMQIFVSLFVISVICACAAAIAPGEKTAEYINICACAAAAVLTTGNADGIIEEASAVLFRLEDYSHASLPLAFTAAAAVGAPSSAAAGYASCCLAIDVIMKLSHQVLLPLISCYLAVAICNAIFENPILNSVLKAVKWVVMIALSAAILSFTSYITLSGTIAGSTDAIALKTTKTVISTVLPVVGGMISDAASAVLASAGLIKNTIGVFGLVSVFAICAEPFLSLLIRYLILKCCSAAAGIAEGTRLSKLLDSVAAAAGMLVGLVGAGAIMLFVSFTYAIRTVGAL